MATMKSEDDLKRVVAFPYVGTFADYMKSRFEITVTDATAEYNDRQINAVGDSQNILNWIQPYKDKIMEQAKRERENYLDYLKSDGDMQAGLSYGTVDVGYYGTNQYYLQRLTGIKTKGYCFYSCLSNKNEYVKYISMKGCFQYDKDYDADERLIRKKAIYVETFITAPNGMAKYIDEENNVVCENNKKSQQYFSIKETVNNGVVKFILDYLKYVEKNSLCNNCTRSMKNRKISIEDMIFDVSLKGKTNISEDICLGFWWDNDYVGKRELKIEI